MRSDIFEIIKNLKIIYTMKHDIAGDERAVLKDSQYHYFVEIGLRAKNNK